MSGQPTRSSSRATTPTLSKADQAVQEEQLRQFKAATRRGADTDTTMPKEGLGNIPLQHRLDALPSGVSTFAIASPEVKELEPLEVVPTIAARQLSSDVASSSVLGDLRAQLLGEDAAAQDLQARLDHLEQERQADELRAQLQDRARATRDLRARLQQAEHQRQAATFRATHDAALAARAQAQSQLVTPPVPNVSFALATGLQALEVAQTKARVDGPPPSPPPPLSSSSSEDTDESHLPSAEEPDIPASQSTTARTRTATKSGIPSTETRVGAELYRQMVRRGESVLEAVQSFKCIDAPHNIAVRYEAERVATIMDMLVGTSKTPPRSRTAIAEELMRTLHGLRGVSEAKTKGQRDAAFAFLKMSVTAGNDGYSAVTSKWRTAVLKKMRQQAATDAILDGRPLGGSHGTQKYKADYGSRATPSSRSSRFRGRSRSRSASMSASSAHSAESGSDEAYYQHHHGKELSKRTSSRGRSRAPSRPGADDGDKRTKRTSRTNSKSRAPVRKPSAKSRKAGGDRR